MRLALTLLVISAFGACSADETISGYADPEAVYDLAEFEGSTAQFEASIAFPEEGRTAGAGPCNQFIAEQSAPYPWFEIGPIAATRRACPELEAEQQFFERLGMMTLAEVSGDVLILSNDDGEEMVFRRRQE